MAGPNPLSSTGWRHVSGNRWQRVLVGPPDAEGYHSFTTHDWRGPSPALRAP